MVIFEAKPMAVHRYLHKNTYHFSGLSLCLKQSAFALVLKDPLEKLRGFALTS